MPSPSTRLLALAGLGLTATAALAGCAAPTAPAGPDTAREYADGDYTAEGDYVSPAGPSHVTVALTLADDIVTAVEVTPLATDPTSRGFQTQFADGIAAAVVGQDIDSLTVSRVGGSSLTSGGFNDALEKIKAEALT